MNYFEQLQGGGRGGGAGLLACLRTCLCVSVCVCVCMCVRACVHMCMYVLVRFWFKLGHLDTLERTHIHNFTSKHVHTHSVHTAAVRHLNAHTYTL
jgi:hypothetical protein